MAKMNINNFGQVEGMLVRDPYWIKTKSEGKIFRCLFTLCVPRGYKNREGKTVYDYPELQFEGTDKQFEYLQKKLVQGAFVKAAVTLRTKKYTDNDGTVKYSSYTECIGLPSIRTVTFNTDTDEKNMATDDSEESSYTPAPQQKTDSQTVAQQSAVQPTIPTSGVQAQPQAPSAGYQGMAMPQQFMNTQWPQIPQQMPQAGYPGMDMSQNFMNTQWQQPIQPQQNMSQFPQSVQNQYQGMGNIPNGMQPAKDETYEFSDAFVPLPDDMPLPFQ